MRISSLLLAGACALALAACSATRPETAFSEAPRLEPKTDMLDDLMALPPPARQLTVAVYNFEDQTGQNKPNETFSEYSRAVTQGGATILVNALERAGRKSWFKVAERRGLPALLQERQIIRAMRESYGGGPQTLPPLTYAGLLLEGGIIGYDSNTLTGGFGARFLGVGGDTQYRRDTVTVYLRAVSVQTGEVLKSVNTTKTIYSVLLHGDAFRYIGFNKLLEIEGGITTNEPVQLAVKQAIEKAVFTLIMEGALDGYWQFRGPEAQPFLDHYIQERDGILERTRIQARAEDMQAEPQPVILPPPASRTPTGGNGERSMVPPVGSPQAQSGGPTYVLPPTPSRNDLPPVPVPPPAAR
ncbi:CsgG/HfaB family protein [Azospirillum picis]|uniref:Curli production assembly/transport component CsgG n=1 Tax=Azospirillum picis TaxID=488438 RepID=A0ABU0MU69_9PROT|nr:CsgG/HfaB family protein [Azospirillum picis]MBP2300934.1 curli production assembly/transport component CsgG [Azospirillum picis]MDQ0537038.1 curli production assembly/transport component CsgG [Azospirillum picis]